ncbi:MAG: hypothetical protein AABZ47_07855 [Planctomycetota bacterium]
MKRKEEAFMKLLSIAGVCLYVMGCRTMAGEEIKPVVEKPVVEKEATMDQILAARTRSPSTDPLLMHFEIIMEGKPAGCNVVSLKNIGKDSSDGFEYRLESMMMLPSGAQAEGIVTARLNDKLEPREVELRRKTSPQNGETQLTVDKAVVGDKEVSLSRQVGIQSPTTRTVPRPDSPFVFGIEYLVHKIDAKRFPLFSIRELNPQDGKIITRHFRTEPGADGKVSFVAKRDDGTDDYIYEVDAEGEIVTLSNPLLPVLCKRCSKERVEELRKTLTLPKQP